MIISEIFFHQPLIYQLDLKWAQGGEKPCVLLDHLGRIILCSDTQS